MRRDVGVSLALGVMILAAYGQGVGHGFVYYDDTSYVLDHPHVNKGLTADGVRWAFTTTEECNWHPLTWLSYMLDVQLFGLRPGGHHGVNVLLHIANSVLLYFVLKRLTAAPWRSAMVAALFALHPLHVESVAWVAERKDVLSTLFLMLSLGAYARYAARPVFSRYLSVFVFLALGLMAKPMLVTAPFLLLLLDYWPLGRLRWGENVGRRVLEKAPLLVLVAASSVMTYVAQQSGGAVASDESLPLGARLANALLSYVAYLGKAVWPIDLAVFYPYRSSIPAWQWMLAAAALAAATLGTLGAGRQRPYLPVGWLWYLGTLVPVIGLVQVGEQAMADRYTYVPFVGLFMAVVWGVADLAGTWRRGRLGLVVAAAVVIASCLAVSAWQVRFWKDGQTLFQRAIEVTSDNAVAQYNLGVVLNMEGRVDEAMSHWRETLRIRPHHPQARTNLGVVFFKQGKVGEAIAQFKSALEVCPDLAEAHRNLALALAMQGQAEEAVKEYHVAIRLRPDQAEARYNLGALLAALGDMPGAIEQWREAVRLKPQDPVPTNHLAWILATHPDRRFRDGAEAVRLAEQACALSHRKDPSFLDTLAAAYAEAGRFAEAAAAAGEATARARALDAKDLLPDIDKRLRLYTAGHPFRDAALSKGSPTP